MVTIGGIRGNTGQVAAKKQRSMKEPISILVVEDEAQIRDILRKGFEAEGFRVFEAQDEASMMRVLAANKVSLITLDLWLGQKDGLELARQVRAMRNIPIVMVTGRDKPMDRIVGLEEGADDYIVKPFHIREVVLRIQGILRRYGLLDSPLDQVRNAARRYAFGDYVLDIVQRELRTAAGTLVELTETEIRLLEFFLKKPGARAVARRDLADAARPRMVPARPGHRRPRCAVETQDRIAARRGAADDQERARRRLRLHRRGPPGRTGRAVASA